MTTASDPHAGQPVLTAGAPLTDAEAVVIAIHGRGATPGDILNLERALDVERVAWLAPAAAGRNWYPLRFISPKAGNQPYLDSALRRIASLVDEVTAGGVPHESIVLLGFSQGACLSLEFAARHPRRWGGVVAFSGGLIGEPGTVWDTPGSLEGTPVFIGCSDVDPHIPLDRVRESAEVMTRMGATVDLRIYPGMPHTVNGDEIAAGRRVLEAARRPRGTASA